MRLAQKISLAFVVGSTAILAANGLWRVRREVELFQADRVRDHDLVGRAVGASFAAVWRSDGEAAAAQLLAAANAGEGRIRLRWLWLDEAGGSPEVRGPADELGRLVEGSTMTHIAPDAHGEDERFTYVPLRVGGRRGALELSERLEAERSYRERAIVETIRTTALLALLTAVLSYLLGAWLVGRPIRALADKARRIGRGDFAGPALLPGRDELSELAAELNATSEQLAEAHERVARETAARIATLEQLRHADRLTTVGKLASGVAHELGTPLNVVMARADMIHGGDATPEQARDYARVIGESARKMTRIIRQLLELARRRAPATRRGDLAAVADRTLETLRPLAARRRVSLALDASGGPYEATLDAAQIEQALTNLVMNSVQATPEGGPVKVSLGRERARAPGSAESRERPWVVVRVEDRGEGIAPENLARVFEPFFTTKEVGSGTGLGLSVAHGIVTEHGGWLGVASQPGQGATFTIYLPDEG